MDWKPLCGRVAAACLSETGGLGSAPILFSLQVQCDTAPDRPDYGRTTVGSSELHNSAFHIDFQQRQRGKK
ncbi:hypothetical protein BDW60DRAFT_182108 [Aspergillus nidulans var. acristatus]